MTSTFTTYSSKTLGGLVIEETAGAHKYRAVLRNDGTAVVYHSYSDRKYTVIAHSRPAKERALRMLAGAKASLPYQNDDQADQDERRYAEA